MLSAADIHTRLSGGRWAEVLRALGVGEQYLRRRKQGPCPVCGGRDRYCYDDKQGRGDFICRHCGAGDGFTLLMRVNRWSFSETARRVAQTVGIIDQSSGLHGPTVSHPEQPSAMVASPTRRVRNVMRTSCGPGDVADVRDYLDSRGLWPLPSGCALRAHAGIDYYQDRVTVGRYPALVAPVRDIDGELATVHVTYLQQGQKLQGYEPRKQLSGVNGRVGCAVRLMPSGDTLGIAEGIETALAASRLHGLPTWSALSTALLSKFEPPLQVRRLLIFADNDVAGLQAAARLANRLQSRITFEIRSPAAHFEDWADVLSQERT